jgi:CCR4-NOT transcriptional regulation complex NOT5 subunit
MHMFYNITQTEQQLKAATELKNRKWTYSVHLNRWSSKALQEIDLFMKSAKSAKSKPSSVEFDPNSWALVGKGKLEADDQTPSSGIGRGKRRQQR